MADKILKELNGLPIFRMSLGNNATPHTNEVSLQFREVCQAKAEGF